MKHFIDDLIEKEEIGVVNSDFGRDMLREAYLYAEANSTDQSTWAGAVITKGEQIVSKGTNIFPKGVNITKERSSSPAKYVNQDHSERNAIYNAAKIGIPLDGTTIYTTWVPCPACTNGIINSGIKRVVFHYEKAIRTKSDWKKELTESLLMLLEAGIQVDAFLGKIGRCKSLFKEKIWKP
ncbi:TPA: hypothetical protein DEP90_03580 [Patescibacteria group bacterium]|nr:hypothetical protein [Patescibacteria group bacterium]